jgi:hypothetical protein
MNNIQAIERFAQGVVAVTATVVSILVFQFAMLVGVGRNAEAFNLSGAAGGLYNVQPQRE